MDLADIEIGSNGTPLPACLSTATLGYGRVPDASRFFRWSDNSRPFVVSLEHGRVIAIAEVRVHERV